MPFSPPEIDFQKHLVAYLVAKHHYAVLEAGQITDAKNVIAEEQLWAFIQATQQDEIDRLSRNYPAGRDELFRELRASLTSTPLWLLLRNGLTVRDVPFRLFYPRPRSTHSAAALLFQQNRLSVLHHYYFGSANEEIDILLFLNGLPIVAIELKHEKNQIIDDAVAQFVKRDHSHKVFSHPFLYIAADTSDVKAATDPRRTENFLWHNAGLANQASSSDEYPVEHLYRDTLSPNGIFEALSFFLVHVPDRPAEGSRPARKAFTIFPRFHQSRMVGKVAEAAASHFAALGNVGRKFLIEHSAGSGKTLSICWLAERLHSVFKPGSNDPLVEMIFILTDRKSLDTNVRDDLENFRHLTAKVGLARTSEELALFVKRRTSIIVTTQQKFKYILAQISADEKLKHLRVAFLIDEAHRSQEGKMGANIRVPFRKPDEPDVEAPDLDDEEDIARIIREHDRNQLFVAFTATPSPATKTLFGAAFDVYTEEEAIAEGYIVDVAGSILSYKTLYNLKSRVVPTAAEAAKVYPAGVIAKALNTIAYQDEGLIQYKAEVMLRIFEDSVRSLVGGRAKAMIVTSSRLAGLRYYNVIKEKLALRGADYQVLYAFSDFDHPETNDHISEVAVNGLNSGELIEDRFDGDDYRLLVVANKFQTGFDQPLLAGMFLDKPVVDRNAVQTVSRLNRKDKDGLKNKVVVVDFTNNAQAILKAFAKYRKGAPPSTIEPDQQQCMALLKEILEAQVFTEKDASDLVMLVANGTDAQRQYLVGAMRTRFAAALPNMDDRKALVYLLAKFSKSYHYLTSFFTYPRPVNEFAVFADYVGPQLIKEGRVSDLMKLVRGTEVVRATVQDQGEVKASATVKLKTGGGGGSGPPPKKLTVQDVIDSIRVKFPISDDEALFIRQVIDEKATDPIIHKNVVQNKADVVFLDGVYRDQVKDAIKHAYANDGRYDELVSPHYRDPGAIFDSMAITVIDLHLAAA